MKEPKKDRRVRRTRRAFREAILALVMEKPFDSLTVTEIAARAGLRRATFYLHYETKEDLLASALAETFDELIAGTEGLHVGDHIGGKSQVAAYLITFQHVAENATLYQQLLSGTGAVLVNSQIRSYLARLVRASLDGMAAPHTEVPHDVIAYFIAGAELSLVIWWLEAEMPYSVEQMAHMAQRLIFDGVHGLLGDDLYTHA